MGKKRRNSILRRPDSAAGEATTETVPVSGTKGKAVKPKASTESEKENQASSIGVELVAAGPVTRKNTRNRRVSFGAHIACKDIDTGRITNLKIPHPSFNSSTSLAVANGSSGSLTSASHPSEIQEMEMSMDDSMGMNKTTVGLDSSDSLALSESSVNAMDVSSPSAAGSKSTNPFTVSLLSVPGDGMPRKSLLPFAPNDLDETNDSLISMSSAICPPGLTGKIHFPGVKKTTADEELDAFDEEGGCDAGFLASMRRVSRGKVVANRKTALDSDTISSIVDVINGEDGGDNSLEMDGDDDMDMEDSVRGIFEMIDGVQPTDGFELDLSDLDGDRNDAMRTTLGKTSVSVSTEVVASSGLTTVSTMVSKEVSGTIPINYSSLSIENESTLSPMSMIQPREEASSNLAVDAGTTAENTNSVVEGEESLRSGNSTLMDETVKEGAMEMTAIAQPTSVSHTNEPSSKSDMEITRVDKVTTVSKPTSSSSLIANASLEVSLSDKTLFKQTALPSTVCDESDDISLSSETSFRRSSRLMSKSSGGNDNATNQHEMSKTSRKKADSLLVAASDQSGIPADSDSADVSTNRKTRPQKKDSCVMSQTVGILVNQSSRNLDALVQDPSLLPKKGKKASSVDGFSHNQSKDTSINSKLVTTEVKEVVQCMAEVSLSNEPEICHTSSDSVAPAVDASNEPAVGVEKLVPATAAPDSNRSNIYPSSETSQPDDDRQSFEASRSPPIPPEAFWLNPQPSAMVSCQPSPQKDMSAGIIDEEMPLMTFDVGGTHDEAQGHPLETSMAVIKDLSSLAALSVVDTKESLINLLSQCCIDVEATDKKWNDVVVPLFERCSSSPETTISLPSENGEEAFKEALLRGHLGEARHLSISLAFNDFKDNYFVKVARLNSLIDKIQNESGETPGFLHEWLEGDEQAKLAVERRVKRMFKLYESKDYKNKLVYLTQFDQTFLDHIESEKTTVRKQLQNLRSANSKVESLLEDACEMVKSQEEEIGNIRNAEKEGEDALLELNTKLQRLEAVKREEEETMRKKRESDAEFKKLAKEKEEEWREKESRKKLAGSTKDKIAVVKNILRYYDAKDSHPWKLENFHIGAGGFFFFRFPRWKFTYDVSLGAATPFTASSSSSGAATFEVASTSLACAGVKRSAAFCGVDLSFKDLDTRLPVHLHQMNYGEESQRMWTFDDLRSRLTDIVTLLDSCRNYCNIFEEIGSLKVDQKRKDWFQMPGVSFEDGKYFMTIHVRRGVGGSWPLALVLKFLLTPLTDTHAAGFNDDPFDDWISVCEWSEFSSFRSDLTEFRATLLNNVKFASAQRNPAKNRAYPPFHQFILDALTETEKLFDEEYVRLVGDRSEMSLIVPA